MRRGIIKFLGGKCLEKRRNDKGTEHKAITEFDFVPYSD